MNYGLDFCVGKRKKENLATTSSPISSASTISERSSLKMMWQGKLNRGILLGFLRVNRERPLNRVAIKRLGLLLQVWVLVRIPLKQTQKKSI